MASLIRRKDPGRAWETEVDTGNGGSQPFRVEGPFTVDGDHLSEMDDFQVAYTPTPGDILVGIVVDYDACTPWQGATNSELLEFGFQGELVPSTDTLYMFYIDADFTGGISSGPQSGLLAIPYKFKDATPLGVGLYNLASPLGPGGALVFSLLVMTP